MTPPRSIGLLRALRMWRPFAFGLILAVFALRFGAAIETQADIEEIYTLPFEGEYDMTCGFGCYTDPFHYGTDYQLGDTAAGGHPVLAAARGKAKLCKQLPYGAGYYIVLDHGDGHHTRYLHLSSRVVTDDQLVERGQVIGYSIGGYRFTS